MRERDRLSLERDGAQCITHEPRVEREISAIEIRITIKIKIERRMRMRMKMTIQVRTRIFIVLLPGLATGEGPRPRCAARSPHPPQRRPTASTPVERRCP